MTSLLTSKDAFNMLKSLLAGMGLAVMLPAVALADCAEVSQGQLLISAAWSRASNQPRSRSPRPGSMSRRIFTGRLPRGKDLASDWSSRLSDCPSAAYAGSGKAE